MHFLSLIVVVIVAYVVDVSGNIQVPDEPYLQEVSHKSVFQDYAAPPESPVSNVWENLPFRKISSSKGSLISLFPQRSCMIAVSEGKLYGSSIKQPTPSLTSLENPYNTWKLIDSSLNINISLLTRGDNENKDGTTFYAITQDNI